MSRPESHIVVGLDAEGAADHAVHAALELRSILSAQIEIVHVVRSPRALADVLAFETAASEEARLTAARRAATQHLVNLYERFTFTTPPPPIESTLRIEIGRPAERLISRARDSNADLVVLGGRHAPHGLNLGGAARELLATSPCSIWMQSTPVQRIRRILAPVDLSKASEHALATAVSLAREFQASVTLLHAFDAAPYIGSGWADGWDWAATYPIGELRSGQQRDFRALAERFAWDDVPHSEIFEERPAARAILDHAKDHDLIVLGTHGRSSALPAALGGTAWSVIRGAPVPVLATRFTSV